VIFFMMTLGTIQLALSIVALALSAMTAAAQDSLRLRLDAPTEVRRGDVVPLALRVENVSDRPLDLHLRGRTIAFDIIVTRGSDASIVWRRLEGEIIPAILQLRTLAAREVLELRAEWNQRTNRGRRVAVGLYSMRGSLLTDEPMPLETAAVELRIVPD
jgi:hypothetical protein